MVNQVQYPESVALELWLAAGCGREVVACTHQSRAVSVFADLSSIPEHDAEESAEDGCEREDVDGQVKIGEQLTQNFVSEQRAGDGADEIPCGQTAAF